MSAKEVVAVAARNVSIFANYTEEQISILKTNVAPPQMSDEQLAYCLSVAKARNLDPLKKQVYFALRNKKVRDGNREYFVSAVTVEPTIDGFRSMAESTGELDGYEGPFWCGEDGVWRDVWLKGQPVAAKITVYRKGRSRGTTAVARFEAYNQGGSTWQKMGDLMLAKCAEALALRKAFPAELGEFYTHEEMGQADRNAFEHLPQEPVRSAAVVSIASPKAEPKPAPQDERKSVLPSSWEASEPIPAAIRLWLTPLSHLEAPVSQLGIDDLELVAEQCANAFERTKNSKRHDAKQILGLLNAIGAAASRAHHALLNAGGAA